MAIGNYHCKNIYAPNIQHFLYNKKDTMMAEFVCSLNNLRLADSDRPCQVKFLYTLCILDPYRTTSGNH